MDPWRDGNKQQTTKGRAFIGTRHVGGLHHPRPGHHLGISQNVHDGQVQKGTPGRSRNRKQQEALTLLCRLGLIMGAVRPPAAPCSSEGWRFAPACSKGATATATAADQGKRRRTMIKKP